MSFNRSHVAVGVLVLGLLLVQAAILFWMGQPGICECGYVELWHGTVQSSGNSQHISDWYTPSHVIHGIVFYLLLWYFFPRMSAPVRLLIAIGIEGAWEITENTPTVIDHYRQQALAQGYIGDSVLNSVFDTIWMIGGFFLAWRLPLWGSVATVLLLELLALFAIRDNLALNVLNLIHVFPAISKWQAGG